MAARKVLVVTLCFVSVVGGDTSLLPYSLSHYRELGVESFHVIRHVESRADPTLGPSVEVMRKAGYDFAEVCVAPWHEDLNAALIRKQMSAWPDDWWIVADLDEFHVYDRSPTEVAAYCEEHGFDFVEGAFLDRVSVDGRLTGPLPYGEEPLWRQYPLAGQLTLGLLDGRPTKVTLARGSVELDLGQHYAWTGRGVPVEEIYAQVHHFKWTASAQPRLPGGWQPIRRASGASCTGRSSGSRSGSSIIWRRTAAGSTWATPGSASRAAPSTTRTTPAGRTRGPRCAAGSARTTLPAGRNGVPPRRPWSRAATRCRRAPRGGESGGGTPVTPSPGRRPAGTGR